MRPPLAWFGHGIAILLILGALLAPRLEGAPLPTAIAEGKPMSEAEAQGWTSVVREHKSGLLVVGGVLAGILLLSAIILFFVVRRARRLGDMKADGSARRGPAFSPPMREAKVLGAATVRGSKAFPGEAAEKSARSGDTTRLTLDEALAAVGDEEPESQTPPLRTTGGPGLWAVVVAWVCLIGGLALMVLYPGSLATFAPLFLMVVLFAVTAMTQRLVLQGSLVLAALYLAVPAVWLTQYLGSETDANENLPQATTGTPPPNAAGSRGSQTDEASLEAKLALAQSEALISRSLPPKSAAPPSIWKQVVPADKANPSAPLPQPTPPGGPAAANPGPPLPSMLVPDLPPPAARAGGALFSYRARLSHADYLDGKGTDLRTLPNTTFGDILLQERLHVHQGGRRDPEDSEDAEFAGRPLSTYRALFAGKEVRLPKNLLLFQLLKDDVIVDVQVFHDFIQVELVSTRE